MTADIHFPNMPTNLASYYPVIHEQPQQQ